MERLLKRISEISKNHEQLAAQSGNNFNVFNVINITTDEVRLHSKFIAELLNPKGTHGQGDVFLNLFIEQFNINLNPKLATVKVEKHIGKKTAEKGGYLDIYVWDNKGQSFIIENKIFAPDQENQLVRYYNFNKNNLFYLTLFGDAPSKDSCGNLEVDTHFKLISYQSDITEWLINCRKESVEFPLLREGISHYINLLKTLTGQSSNNIMNKEIRDLISSSPENLKQATLLEQNMANAKVKIQWLFWEKLKEKMLENNLELVEKGNVTWQNVNNYYNKSRNRDVWFGLWTKIYEKDGLSCHFRIEVENKIYFGFTFERNGVGGIADREENSRYRNFVLDINHEYKSNQHWLGWRYLTPELDFRAFNSKAIFDLADRKKLNDLAEKIVLDFSKDIHEMKNKLNKT